MILAKNIPVDDIDNRFKRKEVGAVDFFRDEDR